MARYQFKVVTRPGEGLGFRLAGVPVEEVAEGSESERFAALLADPGAGVIAVEENLLGRVPASLLERANREGIPILLPFALPRRWEEAGQGERYISALIRRAIGYHVKIQR
jgi:V/A-type H+-transporting ATPase subunit F